MRVNKSSKDALKYFVIVILGYTATVLIVPSWVHDTPQKVQQTRPTQTYISAWSKADSLGYARGKVEAFSYTQYSCLVKLWQHESHWNSKAYDPTKSMGKNAGGIPQVLGLSTDTPAPTQIDVGLSYIYSRYLTPCGAWKHWQAKGWY